MLYVLWISSSPALLLRSFRQEVSFGPRSGLNVAQTTVSARIRNLEQQLGRTLFVRHKGGASLTPAGEQFLRHAPMFVQLWQRTLHQVAVPPGRRAVLTVGSEVSLGNLCCSIGSDGCAARCRILHFAYMSMCRRI